MRHRNNEVSKYRAWMVLGAATGINMTMGLTYSWSVIKKALVADWQWTNVEASLPLVTCTSIFALAMIFAGRMQDKLGPRLIANLGGISLGTGMISSSISSTPQMMMLTYGIVGLGNGMCYASTMPACIKWFPPEKKGLVTGIVVSGVGMAAAYFSPITNWMLSCWGIQNTFLTLGVASSVVIMLFAQFVCNPPAHYKPISSDEKRAIPKMITSNAPKELDWPEMIRTTVFYKLWLMYFFAASAGFMIIGHIATIAKTQANWNSGFYLVILFAIFNTIGRMISGMLSDKIGRVNIMLAAFLLQALNLIIFIHYVTPTWLSMGAALTGLSYGAFMTLFPLATADNFGIKNLGVNYGLVFLAWGFAGILGPVLGGYAVDVTGTYFIAYMISAALLIAAFILAMTVEAPTKHGLPA